MKSTYSPPTPPPDISDTGFHVGTSGYYFDDWIGLFNPPKATAKQRQLMSDEEKSDQDRLLFYQKYFSFVEINNTFYREPVLQSFIDIEKRSRENTMFTVKVHKDISHNRTWNLEKAVDLMKTHVHAVTPLVETGRFYSFLIQLEDRVFRTQDRLDYLLKVSEEAIQRKIDVHIEFRHNSWHHQHALQSLKDNGVGICNTEIPPVPHAFPLKSYATTDKGYVRYSGRNLENWYPKGPQNTSRQRTEARNGRYDYLYSKEEMHSRVDGQMALSKKTGTVAVAFNNHYEIKAVLNAIYNIQLIRQRYGLKKDN